MEFGISGPTNPNLPMSLAIDERIEMLRVAHQYGFVQTNVSHHWISHPRVFIEPWPHMAYMAGLLPGMTVTAFIALPLYHPIDIAEKVATMDILSKGKFVFVAGIGWRSEEFAAVGRNVRHRTSLYEESIELCKRLWAGEEVSYHGKRFQVDSIRMAYTPVQRPHPPIWVAAQSEGAIRRAARIGDAPYVPFQVGYSDLVRLMEAYRDELKKVGRPFPKRMPLARFVSVDADGAKAKERAKAIARFFDWYESSPTFTKVRLIYPFEEEITQRTIAGTPDEVVEALLKLSEEFDINFFSFHVLWPSLEKEALKHHVAFIGDKVLARLRS